VWRRQRLGHSLVLARWSEHAAHRVQLHNAADKVRQRHALWMRLGPALSTWAHHLAKSKRMRHAGRKMLLRWTHMATATALCCWLENVRVMLRVRRSLEVGQQRSLANAFATWIDAHAISKASSQRWKALAIRVATSLHISRWVQANVKLQARQNIAAASRGSDRCRTLMALLPAFVHWHYIVRSAFMLLAQRSRTLASRLARICRTRATCVLDAWMEHARACRLRRRALHRFVGRQHLLALGAWFGSWVDETEPQGYHTPLEGEQEGPVREPSSSEANQSTQLTASTIQAAPNPPMLLSSRRSGALVRRLGVC
jgi:hypothetical protein